MLYKSIVKMLDQCALGGLAEEDGNNKQQEKPEKRTFDGDVQSELVSAKPRKYCPHYINVL